MISKITLTGGRKMMNMAKLGIVSAAGNYFHSLGNPRKQRAGDLMRYTLCVFHKYRQAEWFCCFACEISHAKFWLVLLLLQF